MSESEYEDLRLAVDAWDGDGEEGGRLDGKRDTMIRYPVCGDLDGTQINADLKELEVSVVEMGNKFNIDKSIISSLIQKEKKFLKEKERIELINSELKGNVESSSLNYVYDEDKGYQCLTKGCGSKYVFFIDMFNHNVECHNSGIGC